MMQLTNFPEVGAFLTIAQAALAEAHLSYAVPRYMDQATCEGLIRQMLM